MTQPISEFSDAVLPSINKIILTHSKEQPKRIYLKWDSLSPILSKIYKGPSDLDINVF